MSLLIEEIADELEDQSVGVVGTSIFVTRLPPSPADAIAVSDNGGAPTATTGIKNRKVQVLVRNDSYSDGAAKAAAVMTAMQNNWLTLDTWTVYSRADAQPLYLGVEENGLHTWSLNFTITGKT